MVFSNPKYYILIEIDCFKTHATRQMLAIDKNDYY